MGESCQHPFRRKQVDLFSPGNVHSITHFTRTSGNIEKLNYSRGHFLKFILHADLLSWYLCFLLFYLKYSMLWFYATIGIRIGFNLNRHDLLLVLYVLKSQKLTLIVVGRNVLNK